MSSRAAAASSPNTSAFPPSPDSTASARSTRKGTASNEAWKSFHTAKSSTGAVAYPAVNSHRCNGSAVPRPVRRHAAGMEAPTTSIWVSTSP